ncbi:MAG: rRNA pseudouridine synthase [Bacteroidetes bacterium]|nr:rRNA pseudouridine synthase [Bacteroidota bacterium]
MKQQQAFDKFRNKQKNSKVKETIRLEKRKGKEEKKQRFEERKSKQSFNQRAESVVWSKPENKHSVAKLHQKKNNDIEKYKSNKYKTQQQNTRSQLHLTKAEDYRNNQMPLNKFIAYSGICGRREAALLVKSGKVKVNNDIVYEPGYKVDEGDKVFYNNKQVHIQNNLVYILLNKPKDYITTAKDTHGRKTVFDLIIGATRERVFSVGRLDRNTSGVLLLTNDGELTQKLTHPSFEIKKVYEVKLDKPVVKKDMDAIVSGINLDDGFIAADKIAYVDNKDKSVVGIEIHSGRNRIVRRIFEQLGYDVKSLDRVLFANLTKKNVERGKWRFLSEKELRLLKYMNQAFVKKQSK